MRLSEWPLVFFTIMLQMSVGFVVILSLVYNLVFIKNANIFPKEIPGRMLFFICPVIIAAMLISLFHLGTPKHAIYVLSNISNSWLSREILLTIVFSLFTCGASIILYMEFFSPSLRFILVALSAIVGIALIFTMSRLYMLETVPAWNSYSTPASFFLATLLLGIFAFLIVLTYLFQQSGKNIFLTNEAALIAKVLLGMCLALIIIEIAMWLMQLKVLSGGVLASKISFNNIIHGNIIFSIIRILLSATLVFLLSFIVFTAGGKIIEVKFVYFSFCLLILLELTGRYLFYAMYARIGV